MQLSVMILHQRIEVDFSVMILFVLGARKLG